MTNINPEKWLLLIHQIPPKPNALRVRIWRRLQRIGAVAIKQSVYAMPISEQSREDLSWTLKDIVAGGGDGSISEVRFVEGLTDKQVVALFQNARKSDYEKVIQDANRFADDWSSGRINPSDQAVKKGMRISKLRFRLNEIMAIDFFETVEKETTRTLIKDLSSRLSGQPSSSEMTADRQRDHLKGKIWVTRKNLFVDRIACTWLIRRFVDNKAVLKFVDTAPYTPKPGELRFDMFDGEYTHEGGKCTFEVMIRRFRLQDRALILLSEVVHDIDLKDTRYGHAETNGFSALLTGLTSTRPSDDQRVAEGSLLFENLYAYFQQHK